MSKISDKYYGYKSLPSANEIDPIDVFVGDKVKSFRKDRNLPLSALGKEINVSGTQLSKYESGENRISASRLARLAHFLKIKIGEFFPEGAEWE